VDEHFTTDCAAVVGHETDRGSDHLRPVPPQSVFAADGLAGPDHSDATGGRRDRRIRRHAGAPYLCPTASWRGGSSAGTRWDSRRHRQRSPGRQVISAARCACAGMPCQGSRVPRLRPRARHADDLLARDGHGIPRYGCAGNVGSRADVGRHDLGSEEPVRTEERQSHHRRRQHLREPLEGRPAGMGDRADAEELQRRLQLVRRRTPAVPVQPDDECRRRHQHDWLRLSLALPSRRTTSTSGTTWF
jgi:hypothetical protein